MTQIITRNTISTNQRIKHTSELFGIHFPVSIEPTIYQFTGNMAAEYDGSYWDFYSLSNGGFYMAPSLTKLYQVCCVNGFEGTQSADALGITTCLYAYSHLSFSGNAALAELCANQYHLLRAYMLEHAEAGAIWRAID